MIFNIYLKVLISIDTQLSILCCQKIPDRSYNLTFHFNRLIPTILFGQLLPLHVLIHFKHHGVEVEGFCHFNNISINFLPYKSGETKYVPCHSKFLTTCHIYFHLLVNQFFMQLPCYNLVHDFSTQDDHVYIVFFLETCEVQIMTTGQFFFVCVCMFVSLFLHKSVHEAVTQNVT